eukprot:4414786-Pyramimonas_sp.AAC.1
MPPWRPIHDYQRPPQSISESFVLRHAHAARLSQTHMRSYHELHNQRLTARKRMRRRRRRRRHLEAPKGGAPKFPSRLHPPTGGGG